MAQIGKVEGQIEINCSAEKFFEIWGRKTQEISKMCSDKMPKIELTEGENCNNVGAIITWTYVSPMDGKQEFVRTKVEEIDEERRILSHKVIEGEAMGKYYKSFKARMHIIPKGSIVNNCSIVKCTYEFEKMNEDVPNPNLYLQNFLNNCKDIAALLSSSA